MTDHADASARLTGISEIYANMAEYETDAEIAASHRADSELLAEAARMFEARHRNVDGMDHPGAKALAAIVDGLHGVTPGPWFEDRGILRGASDRPICDLGFWHGSYANPEDFSTFGDTQMKANIRHVKRCDPNAIRAIATYVDALKAEAVQRLEQAHDERVRGDMLAAENERLRELAEAKFAPREGVTREALQWADDAMAIQFDEDGRERDLVEASVVALERLTAARREIERLKEALKFVARQEAGTGDEALNIIRYMAASARAALAEGGEK